MNDLRAAYEQTHYLVYHNPPFTLQIGHRCPRLEQLLSAAGQVSAAFITAWNPMSQILDHVENSRRQHSLTVDLERDGLIAFPGLGKHPSNGWPGEESLLVLGVNLEAARHYAQTYGQLAFVWYEVGKECELVMNTP